MRPDIVISPRVQHVVKYGIYLSVNHLAQAVDVANAVPSHHRAINQIIGSWGSF